jgi:hypothetical protein
MGHFSNIRSFLRIKCHFPNIRSFLWILGHFSRVIFLILGPYIYLFTFRILGHFVNIGSLFSNIGSFSDLPILVVVDRVSGPELLLDDGHVLLVQRLRRRRRTGNNVIVFEIFPRKKLEKKVKKTYLFRLKVLNFVTKLCHNSGCQVTRHFVFPIIGKNRLKNWL